MARLFKKFFIFFLAASLVFPLRLNKTEAASTTLAKTVEFSAGQDRSIRTDGSQFSFYFTNVIIPEASPVIKSAIVEISGISYNDSGNQTVNVDLVQGMGMAGLGVNYTLGGTPKARFFTLKYDASSVISSAVSGYTLYLTGTSSAGNRSFSLFSAKLILTYNSSASGQNFLKTNKFFISQEKEAVLANTEIARPFLITVSEQTPEIRSAFVEVKGIAKQNGAHTIQLSVVKQGLPTYITHSLDLGPSTVNSNFVVRYDITSLINPLDLPSAEYTLYVKNSFDTYLLGAKAIITYKYATGLGGLPPKGELISSTFDTGVVGGAAYNSVMWEGNLNSGQVGQVGLQIAASDSALGLWNFQGPDCTSGTMYTPDANAPMPIETECAMSHNNKRYFRYKVIICSNTDCVTSGSVNPQVDKVIVNWAP